MRAWWRAGGCECAPAAPSPGRCMSRGRPSSRHGWGVARPSSFFAWRLVAQHLPVDVGAVAAVRGRRTRFRLDRYRDVSRVAQRVVELFAGTDVELGEDLAQVVLDRAWADEQPGADLGVGEA